MVLAIVRDVTARRRVAAELRRSRDELEHRVAERTRELSDSNARLLEEQAKLLQAEKLSSVGLLAAGVAHEINNPLSGVMGLIKALQDGTCPPAKRDEYFETVRDGLERMRLTVQGLLDFSRPRAPAWAEIDAGELVAACVRLVTPATRRKDLRVDIEAATDQGRPVELRGDRSQLMQAVVNVLMNAVYVAPTRSRLGITIDVAGGRARIRISDRGHGIAKADLHRICDPFFTTKPEGEGTGLGLAITIGIVRAHDGELTIDSVVGQGTTVTIALPARRGGSADA